ncbi:MAG: cysteine dioxygenase family protein [Phycisphaerae bacterium]
MTAGTTIEPLAPLVAYLDALTGRASVAELKRHITDLELTVADLSDHIRFGQDQYVRNLICSGRWYHVLALCWRSGQRSPIHNHAGSTCGFRVLTGVATETRFVPTPSGHIKAVASHDMTVGTLAVAEDREIHQVSNLQASDTDLITLHVYSPPLIKMDMYSLTDAAIGEFRPVFLEHTSGSGI